MSEFLQSDFYFWVVLPLLIAMARIMDVTINTIRMIFVARGYKKIAPILGFFEVVIWLVAIGQIMKNLDNFMSYIGYGLGFAAGNYIGIILVEKMTLGTVIIRIIAKTSTNELIQRLREANYGVTIADAEGKDGPVKILFSTMKRKDLQDALRIINQSNPHAFYTVEEVQQVNEGYFRASANKSFLPGFLSKS
ncbi:MAG: DUF2179 domain-containing protein [Bacteroidales bacterium]|nr:DUF2179 domain-containing protein [Bacteroidales bacterium]